MAKRSSGVAALERVEAILANRGIYELAELIPPADLTLSVRIEVWSARSVRRGRCRFTAATALSRRPR
jgi:hypothetical protein